MEYQNLKVCLWAHTRPFPHALCLSGAVPLVRPGVAPVSCLDVLPLPLCARPCPCPMPPSPPCEGSAFPHDAACPTYGGLITALLPPLWRALPCAWGAARPCRLLAGRPLGRDTQLLMCAAPGAGLRLRPPPRKVCKWMCSEVYLFEVCNLCKTITLLGSTYQHF